MEDLIEIKQSGSDFSCLIKCSNKVKWFRVEFESNRVKEMAVDLVTEEEKEVNNDTIKKD